MSKNGLKNGFEGMGSVIPIKVARGNNYPETQNAYSAGESCPAKNNPSELNASKEFKICFNRLSSGDIKPILPGSVQLT